MRLCGPAALVAVVLAAAFCGCAGPSARVKTSLNDMIAQGDYAGAEAYLGRIRDEQYGRGNAVLYNLDMGMLLHDDGRYADSNRSFDAAQARMRQLYTVSATKAAGAALANENLREYRGEDFERALSHVFRALNYASLEQPDEALVEVRVLENFLLQVGDEAGRRRSYRDDAFAHLLAAMLYEDSAQPDDARISLEAARKAYDGYAARYGTPPPPLDSVAVAPGMGEVVFLHYNGPAPRKVSKTMSFFDRPEDVPEVAVSSTADAGTLGYKKAVRLIGGMSATILEGVANGAGNVVGTILNVSYPEYASDRYQIAGSEISASSASAKTYLVEDVAAIARRDLAERIAPLKTRSAIRGALKLAQSVVTHVDATQSDFADVRAWDTLPAQIRMARLSLPPGRYDLTASFDDASGRVLETRVFRGVVVRGGHRTYLTGRTVL